MPYHIRTTSHHETLYRDGSMGPYEYKKRDTSSDPKISATFDNYHHALMFLESFAHKEAQYRNCEYFDRAIDKYVTCIGFNQESGVCTYYEMRDDGISGYKELTPIWTVEIYDPKNYVRCEKCGHMNIISKNS